MTEKKLLPPDGGWGWMIVLAFTLKTVTSLPIMTSFGLIFKDKLELLGISPKSTTMLININQAFGMLMGLFNGILLNIFGYRKVAFVSAICIFLGILLTAFSTNFVHFLITFGILTSLGMGLGMSSYSLALNSYFLKNRGKATGITFTLTGIGAILMPLLINYLIYYYEDPKPVVLILAALVAHTFPASLLLQPIKWHMKKDDDSFITENNREEEMEKPFLESRSQVVDVNLIMRTSTDSNVSNIGKSLPSLTEKPTKTKWWSSMSSIPSINLASSVNVFLENDNNKQNGGIKENCSKDCEKYESVYNFKLSEEIKKKKKKIFDKDLLADKVFLIIIFGMSLALVAEMNFVMLTPFMLDEFKFDNSQIATFMSTIAAADLSFRFISPFMGDLFKQTPRYMYLISLVMLIFGRFAFIYALKYWQLLTVAFFLGISKGIRTVYMALILPDYVPIEKLASATSIQMIVNGISFIVGGILIGTLKQKTGTYKMCVVLFNFFTLITILMWITEIMYTRSRSKNKNSVQIEQ